MSWSPSLVHLRRNVRKCPSIPEPGGSMESHQALHPGTPPVDSLPIIINHPLRVSLISRLAITLLRAYCHPSFSTLSMEGGKWVLSQELFYTSAYPLSLPLATSGNAYGNTAVTDHQYFSWSLSRFLLPSFAGADFLWCVRL